MKDIEIASTPARCTDLYAFHMYGRDVEVSRCLTKLLDTVHMGTHLCDASAAAALSDDVRLQLLERFIGDMTACVQLARRRAGELEA